MQLTNEMRQRIVQHMIHGMAIIDKGLPNITSKLEMIARIQEHMSGKTLMPQDVVDAWLKTLVVFLYREVLDASEAEANTD